MVLTGQTGEMIRNSPLMAMVHVYSYGVVRARKRLKSKGLGIRTTEMHVIMIVGSAEDGALVKHLLECGHTDRQYAWKVMKRAVAHGVVQSIRRGRVDYHYLTPKGQLIYDVMREEFGELWDLAANMLVDEVRKRVAKG